MLFRSCNLGNLRYLAMVIESDDAHQVSKVVELLRWLESLGVKNLCLYDEICFMHFQWKGIVVAL